MRLTVDQVIPRHRSDLFYGNRRLRLRANIGESGPEHTVATFIDRGFLPSKFPCALRLPAISLVITRSRIMLVEGSGGGSDNVDNGAGNSADGNSGDKY